MTDKLNQVIKRDINSVSGSTSIVGAAKIFFSANLFEYRVPGESKQNLLEGKVLILMDQFPLALAFPAVVTDLWSYKSDVNYPRLFQLFFRFLRIAGIIFAFTMPGLYIVMNAVNPELLRIQLAMSVAKSREGVPYPSVIEMLLMLLLIDMIVEASIRLPKSIGPTITMIGGIILGQAIVQAKLVSDLLIILLSASTIANFTMAGFLNTVGIRIHKYINILICSCFGIWGLEMSMIWLCFYFANLKIFTVPYLSFHAKGKGANE